MVTWLERCERTGPPDGAVRIYTDEDLYFSVVAGTAVDGVNVVIKYLVIADDRERLIIVREIT